MRRALSAAMALPAVVLAGCVVLFVLFGARSYGNISWRRDSGQAQRAAGQFVVTKLRQSGWSGLIEICDGALICHEAADDGDRFEDVLYFHDGWLMELYRESGSDAYGADATSGDRLLECGGVSFQDLGHGFYSYSIRCAGGLAEGVVRAGRGGAR